MQRIHRSRFPQLARFGLTVVLATAPALFLDGGASAQAPGQAAQFGTAVSRVRADVIVTDSDGNFVDSLTLEDFLLFEDGVEQQILQLELVDVAAHRVIAPTSTRPTADADAAESAVYFLVDGTSLVARLKIRFAEQWGKMLAEYSHVDVPQAAYFVGSTGQVREVVSLTYDLAHLQAAAAAVLKAPLTPTPIADEHRSVESLNTLLRFLRWVAERPGRKSVVWVTTGIKWDEAGNKQPLAQRNRGLPEQKPFPVDLTLQVAPDPRMLDLLQQVARAANGSNGSNVSVYPVDPTHPGDVGGFGFSASEHGEGDASGLIPGVSASSENLTDPLVNLADDTAGRSFIRWSDLDGALEQIVEDSRRFYVLTYSPPALRGDDSYREIDVRVQRPRLKTRGRAGYVDAAKPAVGRD